ncbi:hypothetical protein PTKIN_Ptkin11bG0035000 [Pterospermum kingtungense]
MFPLKSLFSPQPSYAPSPPPPTSSSVHGRRMISTTTIHIMALDGIVNVNSLFAFALFLGLAWYPAPTLIDASSSCAAAPTASENLIACHVYSFSSFLFSSLIASAVKQAIKISKDSKDVTGRGVGATLVDVNLMALRVGMLVSGFCSHWPFGGFGPFGSCYLSLHCYLCLHSLSKHFRGFGLNYICI